MAKFGSAQDCCVEVWFDQTRFEANPRPNHANDPSGHRVFQKQEVAADSSRKHEAPDDGRKAHERPG